MRAKLIAALTSISVSALCTGLLACRTVSSTLPTAVNAEKHAAQSVSETLAGASQTHAVRPPVSQPQPKGVTLPPFTTHIRVADLKIDKTPLLDGKPIAVSFDIVNTSAERIAIPLDTETAKPRYIVGQIQAWIEPLDKEAKTTRFAPKLIRRGSRVAAGGETVVIDREFLLPNEQIHFERVVNLELSYGTYRYYIELLVKGRRVHEQSVEFNTFAQSQ